MAWGRQAGYLDQLGHLPEIRKTLLVDSAAAAAGGFASASWATTYIESAAGVGAGGRTGWVSIITGALFFPFMFLAPLIGMVPPQATTPALIIVGWLMISVLTEVEEEAEEEELGGGVRRSRKLAGIDFHDVALGLSAAIVIMFMPFSFSITDGIAAGFTSMSSSAPSRVSGARCIRSCGGRRSHLRSISRFHCLSRSSIGFDPETCVFEPCGDERVVRSEARSPIGSVV